MDGYSLNRIARVEYQQQVNSLRPVSEFGENIRYAPPGWASRQVSRLVAALKAHLKPEREISVSRQQVRS